LATTAPLLSPHGIASAIGSMNSNGNFRWVLWKAFKNSDIAGRRGAK
jgi:hypothetical protein